MADTLNFTLCSPQGPWITWEGKEFTTDPCLLMNTCRRLMWQCPAFQNSTKLACIGALGTHRSMPCTWNPCGNCTILLMLLPTTSVQSHSMHTRVVYTILEMPYMNTFSLYVKSLKLHRTIISLTLNEIRRRWSSKWFRERYKHKSGCGCPEDQMITQHPYNHYKSTPLIPSCMMTLNNVWFRSPFFKMVNHPL